jgi:hypothetical protein
MSIRKNYLGGYVISDIIANHLFERCYYGYSKREAIRLFKIDAKQNGGN